MALSIGGDDSVAWTVTGVQDIAVELDDPRDELHRKHPKRHAVNLSSKGRFIQGRDPVNTEGKNFAVTIQVPAGEAGARFLAGLQAAATRARPGRRVIFQLPIKRRTYDQIRVDWPVGARRARRVARAGRRTGQSSR